MQDAASVAPPALPTHTPKATNDAFVFYKAMEQLTPFARLTATWFSLEDSERPIGAFTLSRVPIVPLRTEATTTLPFHPAPAKTRGMRRYPAAKRARADGDASEPQLLAQNDEEDNSEGEDPVEDADLAAGDDDTEDDLALFLDEAPMALLQPVPPPADEQPAPVDGASSAGALGDAPLPPPVPPPPEVFRVRGNAAVLVAFPWGRIAYYESKHSFEAVCRNPAHGKCVLTRSSRGRAVGAGKPPRCGRPLGMMAAWLLKGHVGSKEEHWAPENLQAGRAERQAGRDFIKGAAHGHTLLSHERPKADGEASEPEES